jgi:hypothetical protein
MDDVVRQLLTGWESEGALVWCQGTALVLADRLEELGDERAAQVREVLRRPLMPLPCPGRALLQELQVRSEPQRLDVALVRPTDEALLTFEVSPTLTVGPRGRLPLRLEGREVIRFAGPSQQAMSWRCVWKDMLGLRSLGTLELSPVGLMHQAIVNVHALLGAACWVSLVGRLWEVERLH